MVWVLLDNLGYQCIGVYQDRHYGRRIATDFQVWPGGATYRRGTRHADDRRRTEPEEEAHLGQDRDVALQRSQDRRRPRADPRHDEHELRVREGQVVARRAEHELDRRARVKPRL